MTALLTLIFLALFLLLASAAVSIIFGRKVLHHNRRSSAYTLGYGVLDEDFPPELLTLPWTPFQTPGADEFLIRGQYLDKGARRLVVFCHGITWTRYGMFKYLEPFLDGSWNILLYDHRAHGESEGRYPTYGFREKEDLGKMIAFARQQGLHTTGETLLLYGESMGSATVLQYLPLDDSVTAAVVDCPFNSLRHELLHQLSRMGIPRFLHRPFLFLADIYIYRNGRFRVAWVRPGTEALRSGIKLLFCHGEADDYVPTRMSITMVEARQKERPEAYTALHLTPEAEHAKGIVVNRRAYLERIHAFLTEELP